MPRIQLCRNSAMSGVLVRSKDGHLCLTAGQLVLNNCVFLPSNEKGTKLYACSESLLGMWSSALALALQM